MHIILSFFRIFSDCHKICLGNHFFIVIKGWEFFLIYKAYKASIVSIYGIKC